MLSLTLSLSLSLSLSHEREKELFQTGDRRERRAASLARLRRLARRGERPLLLPTPRTHPRPLSTLDDDVLTRNRGRYTKKKTIFLLRSFSKNRFKTAQLAAEVMQPESFAVVCEQLDKDGTLHERAAHKGHGWTRRIRFGLYTPIRILTHETIEWRHGV